MMTGANGGGTKTLVGSIVAQMTSAMKTSFKKSMELVIILFFGSTTDTYCDEFVQECSAQCLSRKEIQGKCPSRAARRELRRLQSSSPCKNGNTVVDQNLLLHINKEACNERSKYLGNNISMYPLNLMQAVCITNIATHLTAFIFGNPFRMTKQIVIAGLKWPPEVPLHTANANRMPNAYANPTWRTAESGIPILENPSLEYRGTDMTSRVV